mgnify:CR=1 FL=1
MDYKQAIREYSTTTFHTVTDDSKYIELVHSGEDYFLRLEKLIERAEKEIHLQTYIFENDETGNRIAACLKEAAQRKVKVYVLLDAYGSSALPDSFAEDLIQHGILLRFFSPLFSLNNFYIGRRMHHKIVVADKKIALIGGINIADKYHGTTASAPWLDYAVQLNCPAAKKKEAQKKYYLSYIRQVVHLWEFYKTTGYGEKQKSVMPTRMPLFMPKRK